MDANAARNTRLKRERERDGERGRKGGKEEMGVRNEVSRMKRCHSFLKRREIEREIESECV